MADNTFEIIKKFYTENFARLCNYVSTYVGNDVLSRDLVHDAFLVMMERYINPPDEKRYNRLITKILKNSIMTYFRETKNKININDDSLFKDIDFMAIDDGNDKEKCIEALVKCFKMLENPGKLVLYLNIYEGFSISEICRMTGIRQRKAYYIKNKTLKILREMLEEEGCDEF
jgi:RNA polymerase sigma factor (sigma-70 family)